MKDIVETQEKNKIVIFLICIISIFLNHQKPISGINISISDIALVLLFYIYLINNELFIPKKVLLFFVFLSITNLCTSVFISPNKFNYGLNINSILNDYIKMVASFLYFLFGYNLVKNRMTMSAYKWYSIMSIFMGGLGIVLVLLDINVFRSILFYEGSRYVGLMNDPNYFSLIQCSVLVYVINNEQLSKMIKALICASLFLSIALSGSKTGMIICILYLFVSYMRMLIKNKSYKHISYNLLFLIFIFISGSLLLSAMQVLMDQLVSINPVIGRIRLLFTDFNAAISANGSIRLKVWTDAIEIIKQSPLLGVGTGSYLPARISYGSGSLAHNTFLQIIAEWGVPFAMLLFLNMINVFSKTRKFCGSRDMIIMRDMLIVFLLGSLSLSLNNARMLWMFFGVLYSVSLCENHEEDYRNEAGF
ncbi:O-antigen ligase like membrane protein [Dethiosulfatibacter aminovorans DSM 17477]|uniref:O-antigen ligase like membrane protein n=1 Tax=Dethiosulfatibacter aminovorans DSM 17477 TaxID=1121476 RepID=A0A1M6IGT2_9FIRM|nr:O-antigen ligase family protein [Dethiosulfatibacter aminovorans]SHJ33701.1 O-antigen ligase like membrane protein [Dethiosulfatibacter aminovorans DSM 17477]